MQISVPREEQPQPLKYAGGPPAGKQLGREVPGGPGGHQAEYASEPCPCDTEGCMQHHIEGGDLSPLLSTDEATSGALNSLVQQRCSYWREPVKGHNDQERTGVSLLCGNAERAWTLQLGVETLLMLQRGKRRSSSILQKLPKSSG